MTITPPCRSRVTRLAATSIAMLAALLAACGNNEPGTTDANEAQPTQTLSDQQLASPPPESSDATPRSPEPRTTAQGLTLTDLIPGTGDPVPPGAAATIEFTAWIVGHDEPFDSTERRRRPLTFNLDNHALIEGLRIGIEGMRPGGTRRIEIPAELGYGNTGRHPIPPDADLIYEVTLIDWQTATD